MSNHDKNKEKDDTAKDHDTALFRQFCQSVRPLKKDNRITVTPDRSKKKPIFNKKAYYNRPLELPYEINRKTEDTFNDLDSFSIGTIEKVASEAVLTYSQPHLHRNLYRQMKRGTLSIEATLDLHQHTADEAVHKTTHFLQTCRERNIRWVLIIHGKGSFSKKGVPVLKSLLNKWLRTKPYVLAFHSAQPKDGGAGALYVLLKLKKGK